MSTTRAGKARVTSKGSRTTPAEEPVSYLDVENYEMEIGQRLALCIALAAARGESSSVTLDEKTEREAWLGLEELLRAALTDVKAMARICYTLEGVKQ